MRFIFPCIWDDPGSSTCCLPAVAVARRGFRPRALSGIAVLTCCKAVWTCVLLICVYSISVATPCLLGAFSRASSRYLRASCMHGVPVLPVRQALLHLPLLLLLLQCTLSPTMEIFLLLLLQLPLLLLLLLLLLWRLLLRFHGRRRCLFSCAGFWRRGCSSRLCSICCFCCSCCCCCCCCFCFFLVLPTAGSCKASSVEDRLFLAELPT
mmetsp:Transcript_11816/g.32228  ORF Transcript_11816/g.32228 Transcript_11816/m.32228 type:complete len:209 (+) Transcript_11816:1699-2325(+)